jgi:hypothetical protein
VTLLLEHWRLLTKPLLYLSLFFKRQREDYYRRLNAVRVEGDWEGWLDFFLDGVATIADEAVVSARELFALVAADRARVLAQDGMSVVALRLFELLPRHPVVIVASVLKFVETSKPTAGRIDFASAPSSTARASSGAEEVVARTTAQTKSGLYKAFRRAGALQSRRLLHPRASEPIDPETPLGQRARREDFLSSSAWTRTDLDRRSTRVNHQR